MPVFLHRCQVCQARTEDLLPSASAARPTHCGTEMARLMGAPFGRVAGSRSTASARPGPALSAPRGEPSRGRFGEPGVVVARGGAPAPSRPSTPRPQIPGPQLQGTSWPKPYADCNATERDARWRDSHEAMAAYQADSLTASGVDRREALARASANQTTATITARAQIEGA